MKGWVVFMLLALAAMMPGASALNVTDNQGYGFGLGFHFNTTADAAGLTLGNETAEAYNQSGTFISRTFDAGQVAYWSSANVNITKNESEHSYAILYSASNSSAGWSSWSGLPQMGRYLNYTVNLSSSNNQTRPVIDLVNITYSHIPPNAENASPASTYATATSRIDINCSFSSVNGLKNISVYWNGSAAGWAANITGDSTGFFNYTNLTISGFPAGAYAWACLAYDSQSNLAWGPNRTVYYQPVTTAPVISSYNVSAATTTNGSAVSLAMYASSTALSSVWINVSYPNASTTRISVSNGGFANFTPPVAGVYSVKFFANDTTGNTSNASASFTAVVPLPMNISVTGKNGASLVSNITFYYAGTSTQAASYSSSTGNYGNQTVPNASCDISMNAYSGNLSVWLFGVEPSLNTNSPVVIDNPSVSGFIAVYAINSSHSMGSARIRLSYAGTNVSSEGNLKMQRCASWNFTASACSGNWTDVSSATDTGADYVQADVSGFSAYGIIQGGYCGDGTCNSGESTSGCPADCTCTDGATRSCSAARSGQCAIGSETCVSGVWAGCPLPAVEVCNQLDDDCDGTTDDVNGGASVEATKCQCYNGGRPVNEACNGMDDDCDGQVDENIQTQCGSSVGACTFGIKTCVNGIFTNCTGGIQSVAEICGNNMDDDCDGVVDNGCASSEPCQFGAINSSGCKCGNLTYTSGYCCFGSFQTEPCFRLPWELLIIFGVMGAVVGVVMHLTRKKNREASWGDLEKRYTPV